jgi:hypothetical protein
MAAAQTYTPLATTTLGSATASYTFSSISGSYTDLVLVMSARTDNTGTGATYCIRYNSDSSALYSLTALEANGTSVISERYSSVTYAESGRINTSSSSNTTPSLSIVNIMNYANTTTYKTALTRSSASNETYAVDAEVTLWRSTAAISSLYIFPSSGNFVAGSTFTLYGIAAA